MRRTTLDAVRRVARRIKTQSSEPGAVGPVTLHLGEVTGVTPSDPPKVSVKLDAALTPADSVYLGSYTPAVGDQVMVLQQGSSLLCLGTRGTSAPSIEPGTILATGRTTAPTGYLMCDGSSLLRTDYPGLFDAIGTTYGAADGTHFSLPDLRQRVPLGKAASGTGSTLGGTGGSKDAVLVSHSHTTESAHSGAISGSRLSDASAAGAGTSSFAFIGTSTVGGSATDANLPPYVVVNWMIKI